MAKVITKHSGTGPECKNIIDMNFTTYFNQTKQLFGKLFIT